MKKNYSLPDDAGAAPSYDFGDGAPMALPVAANDGLIFDDGEPFALFAAGSGSVSAGSAKPVASIATLADYLINGFWQYNSAIAHHWASSTITYNISGLNAAEQFLAQSALQAWHEVANVTFVQTTGSANITFSDTGTMQAVTSASWYSNGTMASANVDISSDWIANDGGAMDGKTGIDSYGYQSYIHEIGHALGLGHQGPYNGSAVYSTDALYADDTWQYSIMSYFSQNNYSGSTSRYVVSPQMADIYAVDSIYGAATTRTGDTVYGFHSNAGAVFDFSAYTRAPALTIYDSGGNDTLDCSGYSAAQTIDLHAGAFSSVGGLVNNIGIALGATIENAIGGSGNDTLIANDNGCTLIGGGGNDMLIGGAGSDRLVGGTGVDTMTGNGGADTFVFATGDSSAASGQHDRITDFVSGVDKIDLSAIDGNSGTGGIDQFYFISGSAFDGAAGELDYFYNSALGVTTLQGDTNGDRVADFAIDLVGNITISMSDLIGAFSVPVVIESAGATTLTMLASSYYLYANGTSTGPSLKFSGTGVVVGLFGTWAPIGAEATTAGYEVAWKVAGADQYLVWNTDSSGNYLSNATDTVSGTSAALESLETSFHQDLNGDGVIGLAVHASAMLELTDVYSGLVTFSSPTGTLKLDAPSTFNGQIAGFTGDGTLSGSDQIDLGNMTFNNSIQSNSTYNNSTGLLTVANGTTVDLLHFVGSYSLANFKFANDGHGGTIVYDPPVTAEGEASDAAIHVTGSSTLGGSADLHGGTVIVDGGATLTLDHLSTNGVTIINNGTVKIAGESIVSIRAGADQDTFVFKPNFGQATIENFKPGADSIHIDSAVFADMATLLAMAHDDSHGNVVITDAAHDILTIQNVTSAQIHLYQDAFHFV